MAETRLQIIVNALQHELEWAAREIGCWAGADPIEVSEVRAALDYYDAVEQELKSARAELTSSSGSVPHG